MTEAVGGVRVRFGRYHRVQCPVPDTYRFLRMVLEENAPDKDVTYYAERLNITPVQNEVKHLLSLVLLLSCRGFPLSF